MENFIPAPQTGEIKRVPRIDIDKEVKDMNEEEKAVFDCLEDEEGEYEELDDDFLF